MASPQELLQKLEERFILGEVSEETYKLLKANLLARLGGQEARGVLPRRRLSELKAKEGGDMMRLGRGEVVGGRSILAGVAVLLAALAGGCSTGDQAGSGSSGSAPSQPKGPGTGNPAVPGGKELVLDLGGGVKMEFVMVPAGSFQMGSYYGADENPMHKVTIAKPFYMGKYEVTAEQWKEVMGSFPGVPKGPNYPVDEVSWDSAQKFVRKLSQNTGRKLSLPSDTEWEYACRAGSTTEFSFGDYAAQLGDYAWYKDNCGGCTHPVGEKKPNAWGLYDMHGNVFEWCEDVYHGTYSGAPADGTAWPKGGQRPLRFLRGGAQGVVPEGCRSAYRLRYDPASGDYLRGGCRVVLRDF